VSRLEETYDAFGQVEEAFRAALDESLGPRGPDVLYDVVGGLGLPTGSVAVDVGCGDGRHSFRLAERFGFTVTGLDPVPRQIERAQAELRRDPRIEGLVRFELGSAEALPFEDGAVDLVWCRDVLVHVADLERAYAEFRRVLRANGRAVVYQTFGTERLEPREAGWLWSAVGVVPSSTDRARAEAAIAAAGLRIEDSIGFTGEWGERAEERTGERTRRLLHASRLLRDPARYVERFGQAAYEIMLGDCLWHVYGMIGKLEHRVYVLVRTRRGPSARRVRS
jgi:SAM-dependent methyltransferase